MRWIIAIIAAAFSTAPTVDAPVPRDAAGIAAQLATVRPQLREAVAGWRAGGFEKPVPREVVLLSLYEQRLVMRLSDRPRLLAPALRLLPARERAGVRDEATAGSELRRLSAGWPPRKRVRTGPALAPQQLWRFYREARGRFGVSPALLAAVNYVESAFGKMRDTSVAGAQGPMQFMPATWRAYGLGGDIHDPHDAILGAANYLHANGAPRDEAAALYHYNPSPLYVDAVLRYARRIRREGSAFGALYARQVFVRTAAGRRRVTGPTK